MKITSIGRVPTPEYEPVRNGALEIFWQTAGSPSFDSVASKAGFCYRYFDYYWYHEPSHFYVAIDDGGVCGYLCGVAETRNHAELYKVAAHVAVFDDLYDRFPAHLHINVHGRTRGQGVGSALIEVFCGEMQRAGARGVHLVTSVGARNVAFYRKNGFDQAVARPLDGAGGEDAADLQFLGRRLAQ